MLNRRSSLLALASLPLVAACGGGHDDTVDPASRNIVQAALADPQFSLLAEAVVAAGLTATLSGPGPFTVFAPTNAAFTALLAELGTTKEALFADRALLTTVLTYHVLGSRVGSAAIPIGRAITTVQGGIFKIDRVDGALRVQDGRNRTARIVAADVGTSNGVIHAIDRVLLPANRNVVETAVALANGTPPQFTLLVEAVVTAGLAPTLSGTGPFTVFAPTDAAFAALLAELGVTKEALFANTALLTSVLTYHVLPLRALRAEVPVGNALTTVQGQTLTVNSAFQIVDQRGRSAAIVATDTLASNGVIHVIDRVILPRA
ncbi:fasciclin domain-containing protein [Piscinibacter sakaiensis]|uniref:FAS1 domain-containing protein n=1 Tax=Piscinibacter sakaiensis TaxID=1547922 RepID=A0A0K8P037_PISS1|nr:fasciclin domain-containing protein [Piscinibacter sakaiensis]GAP35993.1 hypothetical protein ISF6_1833 [Piscinibacter sakaiensis]